MLNEYFVNKTMVHTTQVIILHKHYTSIYWIHCKDQPKTFTLLLKS